MEFNIEIFTNYFTKYGAITIFIVVFLEYLNLPGFPAGVIMPLAGIWTYQGGINFFYAYALSILAGLCGSWVLYLIGKYGGMLVINKYIKRFPKHKEKLEKIIASIEKKGYLGVFIGKLIPVARTLVSLPAGALKLNFAKYTVASGLGIAIWNFCLIGAGYIFGQPVINYLS